MWLSALPQQQRVFAVADEGAKGVVDEDEGEDEGEGEGGGEDGGARMALTADRDEVKNIEEGSAE